MFPSRNSFYTYQGLVNAAASYSTFAGSGDTAMKRREAAAAMANFHHETGGLVYITEIAQGLYCGGSTPCGGCASGKSYYGRGPIQLSWNFNYCAAGQALGHGTSLWSNPDQVAQNATTAWQTALWYWMTQTGPHSSTPHNCIVNNQGFGCTIRAINGSVECNGNHMDQVQNRINKFTEFRNLLGTTAVGGDSC
jgi:predicted chitinase